MDGLGGGVAGLDPRRLRFHDLPVPDGTDRQRVRRLADRCSVRLHPDPVDAPVGRDRRGLALRPDGRKTPLMISIGWYSVCNFIAGFSPSFLFLLVFRTLLGIGMGAEWPAGAALAME